ncbi:MAG: hypothetical protein Q9184_005959 [Pyrenodesmia sp. 2 TL-2023]
MSTYIKDHKWRTKPRYTITLTNDDDKLGDSFHGDKGRYPAHSLLLTFITDHKQIFKSTTFQSHFVGDASTPDAVLSSYAANRKESLRLFSDYDTLWKLEKTLLSQLARSFPVENAETNAWRRYFNYILRFQGLDPFILSAVGQPYPATDAASDHWRKQTVHLIRRVSAWMLELQSRCGTLGVKDQFRMAFLPFHMDHREIQRFKETSPGSGQYYDPGLNISEYTRHWEETRAVEYLRYQVWSRLQDSFAATDGAVVLWHQQLEQVSRKISDRLEELKGLKHEFVWASVRADSEYFRAMGFLDRNFEIWKNWRSKKMHELALPANKA